MYKSIFPLIPVQEGETFLPITTDMVNGVKPYYHISNYGRVYNACIGRMMSLSKFSNGYVFVALRTETGYNNALIHRLIMKAFKPISSSEEYDVNHINGIKDDNSLDNLEWCTHSYNMLHAYNMGLNHTESNITEEQAKRICELLSMNTYTIEDIAKIIGCPACSVTSIKQRKSFTRISKDYHFESRCFRLFSDDDIIAICEEFQRNPKLESETVNDYCRRTLISIGLKGDDRYVDTVRKIYKRKYFSHITKNYNY